MKTTENKDAYSTPDYERMTFEISGLAQMSGGDGNGGKTPITEDEVEEETSPSPVNFFRS